jgi:hypothetical protein
MVWYGTVACTFRSRASGRFGSTGYGFGRCRRAASQPGRGRRAELRGGVHSLG